MVTHPGVPSPSRPRRPRRIAFYSHDTQGLGHTRRNIAVAAAMAVAHPDTEFLLLTGAPEATVLPLPPATEVLTLPTLRKHRDGHYTPRRLSGSLSDLLLMRAQLADTALACFDPDLLVVDKVPRGVEGELDLTLRTMRSMGRTRLVLGLRDILDTPAVARREWEQSQATEAVRDLYDAVWVYGDAGVYDPVREYGLPPVVERKVVHTGYLAGPEPATLSARARAGAPEPPEDPYVLCTVGGGEDGRTLADAFVESALPRGLHGVLLTGPHMPAEHRRRLAHAGAVRDDLTVHEFVPGARPFIARAEAVVSMAGYNSVCEVLATRRPALLVPRVTPRREQALRAERLARAGWVDVVPPAGATPARIGAWLAFATATEPRARQAVDLDGLTRIPRLVDRLVAPPVPTEVPDVAV